METGCFFIWGIHSGPTLGRLKGLIANGYGEAQGQTNQSTATQITRSRGWKNAGEEAGRSNSTS